MKSIVTSWLGSIGVGLATAVVAALVGGWIANRAVGWYHVSSFEGASGYAVVFQALLAFVIAFIIGVITSRVIVGGGGTLFKAALIAQTISLGLLVVIGWAARAMADVSPTIGGEKLMLSVEVSWPEAMTPMPAASDSLPYIELAALSGQELRAQKQGPLWVSDTRREDDRVIVPGAVEVFTGRGQRMLTINTGGTDEEARFLLPLPGSPGASERQWSDWLPKAKAGDAALPDGVRYRFRVVTANEPIRSETIGPFVVSTLLSGAELATYGAMPPIFELRGRFEVTYQGTPVSVMGRASDVQPQGADATQETPADVAFDDMSAVAVIHSPQLALVVQMNSSVLGGYDYLLQPDGDRVKSTFITADDRVPLATRLPKQSETAPADSPRVLRGDIDHTTFAEPGLYLVADAVLDTRTLTVRRMTLPLLSDGPNRRAISLSPDERRFVRMTNTYGPRSIEEITIASGTIRSVPAEFATVPTGRREDIDRAWFDHYFTWQQDANGEYQVVPRPDTPRMPFRGTLTDDPDYREYRINQASPSLRDALLADLVDSDIGATEIATADGAFAREFTFDGGTINLAFSDGSVMLWMERGSNSQPLERLAKHIDSVLATRRLDKHFVTDDSP